MEKKQSQPKKMVYISYIEGSQQTHKKMTYAAARKAGLFDSAGYAFIDEGVPGSSKKGRHCEHCGCSQKDFENSGKLGCVFCFDYFSEPLHHLIEKIHKGTTHKGKVPNQYLNNHVLNEQLVKLRKALEQAISEEKYETAAQYRDGIIEIENTLKIAQ